LPFTFFILSFSFCLSLFAAQFPPLVRPFTELEELETVEGRAFALRSDETAPLQIVKIDEIHSPDGRARFAYFVRNRSTTDVRGWTVVAGIVGTDGTVKATQPMKDSNLKPGQTRRKEITFRTAVPSISDAVAFAIAEIQAAADDKPWRIDELALETIMGQAARSRRR
jgi:hypothetical protein